MIKSYIDTLKVTGHSGHLIEIDAEELVINTMELMMRHREFELPVYMKGSCVGLVFFQDLIVFLAHDLDKADIFVHKLNYTVESAVTILMKMKERKSAN